MATGPSFDPTRPLRVLWVVKGLGPGGAERLLVSMAEAVRRPGIEIEVAFVLPHKQHLRPALEELGVRTHLVGRGPRDLRWPWRLAQVVRGGDVDVVHVHSPLPGGVARLAAATAGRRRPRLVSTEHNQWGSHAVLTRALNAATWSLDDVHLAVSTEVADSVRPRRRRARVEVVVHGVPLDAVRAAAAHREATRAELGLSPDDVAVLNVGNLRHQKAHDVLIAAARLVCAGHPAARFLVVGQGPLEAEVARWHAESGLGDRFRLLGYRDDVPRLLGAADVFCLPSRYEGYPVAVMEALAAGLPVVGSRVSGLVDAVSDGVEGRLVPPGDVDALAAALGELVDDADVRRTMAAAAGRRAGDYDIRRAAERHLELYRALAARRG